MSDLDRELTDDEVDEALINAIMFYDPKERYPEYGAFSMRAAYRAGFEDGRNA